MLSLYCMKFLFVAFCFTKRDVHKIDALNQWCLCKLLGIKWYHHVGVEWWCEMENWATTSFSYCSSTASLPVWPYCVNVRRIRCQADLNSFPLGELEETTGTPPYYVDEDYPAGPGIIEPLPERSNWRGSESLSTLENDVYVWRYALIVVHDRNEWTYEYMIRQFQDVLASVLNHCYVIVANYRQQWSKRMQGIWGTAKLLINTFGIY